MSESLSLHVAASDAHRHWRLSRRDDNADARVAATTHRSTTSIHHEADQEPEDTETKGQKALNTHGDERVDRVRQ